MIYLLLCAVSFAMAVDSPPPVLSDEERLTLLEARIRPLETLLTEQRATIHEQRAVINDLRNQINTSQCKTDDFVLSGGGRGL